MLLIPVVARSAGPADVVAIAELVSRFVERGMLPRTQEDVALALDDYVVLTDGRRRLLACGALREYSPSVAEVSSIAVCPTAQGQGLGRRVVREVEQLARRRGYSEVFLVTVKPAFFRRLGYCAVDRGAYPEKQCPHTLSLAECARCDKMLLRHSLASVVAASGARSPRCEAATAGLSRT